MKLWLLKAIITSGADDPWDDGYDCFHGFVVRAASEAEARALAQAHSAAHDAGETRSFGGKAAREVWTDPAHASCEELGPEGEPGVILDDFQPN